MMQICKLQVTSHLSSIRCESKDHFSQEFCYLKNEKFQIQKKIGVICKSLTKISPIKMKCRSMASEYLPVGIPVLQIKDIRVDRAAILIFVGSCYFLHHEPTEHWKIWNPVLKTEILLIFLLFFRQTSYRVLHFETRLYKFAA